MVTATLLEEDDVRDDLPPPTPAMKKASLGAAGAGDDVRLVAAAAGPSNQASNPALDEVEAAWRTLSSSRGGTGDGLTFLA